MAVDGSGNALTYDGTSWSTVDIDSGSSLYSVDCPTTSFCAAVDLDGNALTYGWVSASYSCDFPGLGDTTTHVLLSEAPSPPASITAPGTFQTTLSSDVTIPSAAVNYACPKGRRASRSARNLSRQMPSVRRIPRAALSIRTRCLRRRRTSRSPSLRYEFPIHDPTTYNPETWQSVNVPGTVDFTPGDIDFTLTELIDGTPTPVDVSCTPPAGVTDLDTTNIVASSATPSFQVPPSVPPLQAQVTAPLDAGWAIEIANTSTVAVNGLSAQVTVRRAREPSPMTSRECPIQGPPAHLLERTWPPAVWARWERERQRP